MTDSLEFTHVDHFRASLPILVVEQRVCMAIVRIVAETDWPSLEPDDRAELLAALQFNASETLASIDEKDS